MSRVFGGCRALMAASRTASASNPASKKAASKKAESKKTASKKAESKKAASPRRSGGPLTRELPVSPAMFEFLGVPEIARCAAVKKIWEYIKLHQLQNPENKREILCDEKLKTIFDGKDKVGMLEMGKLTSAHFLKPN